MEGFKIGNIEAIYKAQICWAALVPYVEMCMVCLLLSV